MNRICFDKNIPSILSDNQLTASLQRLLKNNRHNEAQVIRYLLEVLQRKLYAKAGYTSMFAFCQHELRFSAWASHNRIAVARASNLFPEVLGYLERGDIHLSGLGKIAGHLQAGNVEEVLRACKHKSK